MLLREKLMGKEEKLGVREAHHRGCVEMPECFRGDDQPGLLLRNQWRKDMIKRTMKIQCRNQRVDHPSSKGQSS